MLVIGLALSIPLVIFGSALLLKVIERFPIIVWLGAALLGFVALSIRALQSGETAASAFVFIFFLLFAWQVGTYFYRNRPGAYWPDAPPAYLLPKG